MDVSLYSFLKKNLVIRWHLALFLAIGLLCGLAAVVMGEYESNPIFSITNTTLNSAQTELAVSISGTPGFAMASCTCGPPPENEPPCPNRVMGDSYMLQNFGVVQIGTINSSIPLIETNSGNTGECSFGGSAGSAGAFSGSTTINVSSLGSGTYTLSVTACKDANPATCSTQTTPITIARPSCTLSANPSVITSGNASVLSWTSQNATGASLDQGIGAVSTSGSRTVTPTSTKNYTLSVTGPTGSGSCSRIVTVSTTPACDFTLSAGANPSSVAAWQDVAFTGTVSGETNCSGNKIYEWDWTNDGTYDWSSGTTTANTTNTTYAYPNASPATKTAKLRATFGGTVKTATTTVTVTSNAINGQCGGRTRNYTSTETTWGAGNFCDTGPVSPASPVFPAAGSSTTWTCLGQNGGTNASCTATRDASPTALNGQCGSYAHTYLSFETEWGSGSFCSTGTAVPASPAFPAAGGTTTWDCQGQNGGATASCSAYRSFSSCNVTTQANANPNSGNAPLSVQFIGSVNGSAGCAGSPWYQWDFDSNGTWDSYDAIPVHQYTTPGTYNARFRGGVGSVTGTQRNVTITVTGTAVCDYTLTATANPSTGHTPLAVTLAAATSGITNCTGSPTYRWDYTNNGSYDTTASSTAATTHSYDNTASPYTAKVEATWNGIVRTAITSNITVTANTAPTVSFAPTPTSGESPLAVLFDITANDPEGDPLWHTYYSSYVNSTNYAIIADANLVADRDGKKLDYNNDGYITEADANVIKPGAGTIVCPSGKVCDLNNDGTINGSDYNLYVKFGTRSGLTNYVPDITYTYETPGTYTAKIYVTDGSLSAEASDTITVSLPANVWSGNMHNSAFGPYAGWILFGDPTGTAYEGLYNGVTIATERSGGSYPLSGNAYSPNFGQIDFSTVTAAFDGNWGILSGEATFTSTGEKMTLSSGVAPCDIYANPLTAGNPDINNYGVCINPFLGYVYGYGWTAAYGWIEFSGNRDLGIIGSPPVSDDPDIDTPNVTYQVTVDWNAGYAPLASALGSDVYAAAESIGPIELATLDESVPGEICDQASSVRVYKISDTQDYDKFKELPQYDSTSYIPGIDYVVNCTNNNRTLTLTMYGGDSADLADTAGNYHITGTIFGNDLKNPATGIKLQGVSAGDPVVIQIVAAEPCWDCGQRPSLVDVTPLIASSGNLYPVADDQDSYDVNITLRDRFTNPVNFATPLWFDPTKQVADVGFTVSMDDLISAVQIAGESGAGSFGDATKYTDLTSTDIPLSGVITPETGTSIKKINSLVTASNEMRFTVTATAPTNTIQDGGITEINTLEVNNLTFSRTARAEILQSGIPVTELHVSDVTQQMEGDTTHPHLSGSNLTTDNFFRFAPLLTARAEFLGGIIVEGRQAYLNAYLNKKSTVSIENTFWLQRLRSRDESGQFYNPEKISFTQFQASSSPGTQSTNFFEVAESGTPPINTAFSGMRSGTVAVELVQPLPIDSGAFEMSFVPEHSSGGQWLDSDRIAYQAFASYDIDGQTVKYMMASRDKNFCSENPDTPGCLPPPPGGGECNSREGCCALYLSDPDTYAQYEGMCSEDEEFGSLKFSIIGETHGDVSQGAVSNTAGVTFHDGFIPYESVQQIVRNNLSELTRGTTPVDISAYADPSSVWHDDGTTQFVDENFVNPNLVFSDIAEMFLPGVDVTENANATGRLLQNGQVLWIQSTAAGSGCTVIIRADSVISEGAPKTVILDGCNLYLKGNITGNGNVGFIVLRNRNNAGGSTFSRYGNVFVDPRVTNIKGLMFAEGSLLTLSQTLGVFDGFSYNASEENHDAWNQELGNQLYMFGAFASRNTIGGLLQVPETVDASKVQGIPNDRSILMPVGKTFADYQGYSFEDRKSIAMRYDLSRLRQFIRTLAVAGDFDGDGFIDGCGTTPECTVSPESPKTWVLADPDHMQEAQRFDGQSWAEVVQYDNSGALTTANPLEDIKYKSQTIFQYNRDLTLPDRLPIGFTLPAEMTKSQQ